MSTEVIETSLDNLYRELDDLKTKNAARKADIANLRKRIDESADERDGLNAEVKKLSDEVKKLKSQRDALNGRVKQLKMKRDELRTQAAEKRESLTKLLDQTHLMSEQIKGSVSELYRQINSLEWYIQTNPLAPKTERNIIAKISILEHDLAKHKGLRNVKDKLVQLRVEVGALRIQAQATHAELMKIAEESEKVHKSMYELAKKLIERKKEADAKHARFLDLNQERREAVSKLRESLERIDQLRTKIGETKESQSPRLKGEKVKSQYKEAATEKMRTGGKLSFEEFQALMEDSGSDTDED